MKYVLSYTDPENHFIDFSLTVNGFSLDQIIVQLPAWRPGRYELGNFAKNIKGFEVNEVNCNKAGIAHGGTLISFADGIMGYTAWKKDSFPCLTAKLSANYIGPAPKGSWVYGFAEVIRETNSILFMRCSLFIRENIIFTADGIFKIIRNRGKNDPS